MKKIFKINMYLLVFAITFLCISFLKYNVRANDKNMLSEHVEAITERYERDLIGGVKLYKQSVLSYWDGIVEEKNLRKSTVQWVDLPGNNEEIKIVTWSQGTEHAFKSSTVRYTAEHYEQTHPGWIVVAAVNGDFFEINSTYEALGLMVQDGDVIKAHQQYPASVPELNDGVLGWDDNNKLYVGFPQISTTLTLQIRDDNGNYTKKVPITSVNGEVAETGITLITKDKKSSTDFTGSTVYVGKYDLNRISNSNKVFVKGTITDSFTNIEKASVEIGKFYLASKDGSLEELMLDGAYVRCQYDLEGEWGNVTSAIRYYHMLLIDGKHKFYRDSFNHKVSYGLGDKSRCVIGFKEDGSTVMMVADGRAKVSGEYLDSMTYFQVAEMMKIAGCKDVYQMDGGGSATLLVRNDNGRFDVINTPSDGTERHIGNAILFVMRDPGLSVDLKNTTRTSISIVKKETSISSLLEDIKITIDGQTHSMVEDLLVIEGLKESTEYLLTFSYVLPDYSDPNKKVKGSFNRKVKTRDFEYPPSGLEITEVNKNSIIITKKETGFESWIQNVVVRVGDNYYNMGNESLFVIDNLFDETEYLVTFEYDVFEPNNPIIYKGQDKPYSIKTLAFNLPIFEKFEIEEATENSVSISYEYDDEDDVIVEAYVIAYNEMGKTASKQRITRKRGTVNFTGLDLTSQSYSFKIEILYKKSEEDSLLSSYFSDEIIQEKLELNETKPGKGCGRCTKSSSNYMIATLSVASLAILVFRKKK